jgi:RES domain-containing protein
MAEFESYRSYWKFQKEVRGNSRYFWSVETDSFLEALKGSWCDREFTFKAKKGLWRAQVGCDWSPMHDNEGNYFDDEPAPFKSERMVPLPDQASEGRVNPKGIPVLYTANDRDTAIAEVRPWIGSYVSVAHLNPVRDLKIIDCSLNHSLRSIRLYFVDKPTPEEKAEAVWAEIDCAFSRPVQPTDQTADYVPTQILAEFFRSNGFDGMLFKSSVSKDGANLVLFNPDDAVVKHRQVVEIKSVDLECEYTSGDRFKNLD